MRGIDELDHYELLEIGRSASATEIDRAYRNAQNIYQEGSLALYSVFDRLDTAAIRQRLDEAYRVLADAELRAQYDEYLPSAEERSSARDPRPEVGMPQADPARVAPTTVDSLSGFDPAEQLDSVEQAVEEFDALEDDSGGEYDGVRLRRNRLFRGYEIDDIADVTKVGPAHLRNIEEENFVDLPAVLRPLRDAYAQTIGLDPKIVVPSYMARVQESRAGQQRAASSPDVRRSGMDAPPLASTVEEGSARGSRCSRSLRLRPGEALIDAVGDDRGRGRSSESQGRVR